MKIFFRFFISSMPFTFGIIIVLISLAFLVESIRGSFFESEFWSFVILATIGIPILLFGIDKLSVKDNSEN